ncbi:MAG: sugar phosphate nucleotidyltransferase, partial [Candidatus Aenigmatarchaeota archaeon]
ISIGDKVMKEIDATVDGIFIRNRSQAIESLISKALGENKIAVILAGGKDKNMKMGGIYKSLLKVGSETIIESSIRKLREEGFKTIYIVAGRNVLTEIVNIIGDGEEYGVKINLIDEKDPQGDANSLKMLRGKIKTTFLVVFSDVIFSKISLSRLWSSHLKLRGIATLAVCSSPCDTREVGTVNMEGSMITQFNEKPLKAESSLFWTGIFVAEPEIISYGGLRLGRDLFPLLAEKGFLYGHIISDGWYHIHDRRDYEKVKKGFIHRK